MKMCDNCKQKDEKHKEVGIVAVSIVIEGFHYKHHTHSGIPESWCIDLCPSCAKELKIQMGKVVDKLKGN